MKYIYLLISLQICAYPFTMSANNQFNENKDAIICNGIPEYFQLQIPIMSRILGMMMDFRYAKYAEKTGNYESNHIKFFMHKYESYENYEILLKQEWNAYRAIEKEHSKDSKKYMIDYTSSD